MFYKPRWSAGITQGSNRFTKSELDSMYEELNQSDLQKLPLCANCDKKCITLHSLNRSLFRVCLELF